MAESTKGKNKKPQDAFADDLDAMLDTESAAATHEVGLIDDDDAIDRLLMTNNFQNAELASSGRDEIDALIGDEFADDEKATVDLDDLDDIFSEAAVKGSVNEETDEFSLDENPKHPKASPSNLLSQKKPPVLDQLAKTDLETDLDLALSGAESEVLVEIDEFSEEIPKATEDFADFLMADFDISSGQKSAMTSESEPLIDEFSPLAETKTDDLITDVNALFDEPVADHQDATIDTDSGSDDLPIDNLSVDDFSDDKNLSEDFSVHDLSANDEPVAERSQEIPVQRTPPPERPAPVIVPPAQNQSEAMLPVDFSAELNTLLHQLTALKNQQLQFKQQLTEKVGHDDLQQCLEDVSGLQTEQKKVKRVVDVLNNKKPMAAYIANGLAATGLLIGFWLGFQNYVMNTQLSEMVAIVAKLQEQINTAPASEAADKEMLRKQMDELTVANSVTANQLAEITKALKSDVATSKSSADDSKASSEVTNQLMQIGATIESLESKVVALEKGRNTPVVAVVKPEKKKPLVVEENWAVNLVAFKQDWYAKRKAEEFAGKGVPAKVSKSELKGEDWYRLSVDGFKSQYEAAGYAARVKKTLNLDSVAVSKISSNEVKE